MRGATPDFKVHGHVKVISIHAPLAGSDLPDPPHHRHGHHFNPRSPCGERRDNQHVLGSQWGFQSTLPLRGATYIYAYDSADITDFNPRSPCGERHEIGGKLALNQIISIHAPLAGSDVVRVCLSVDVDYFNPRSPCGERRSPERTSYSPQPFQSTLPLRGATITQ